MGDWIKKTRSSSNLLTAEDKGWRMVKELDFEAEKKGIKIKYLSNFVFLSYGHFPARNESKSTIATK